MKTIVKIIWFSLAITFRKYVGRYITVENVGLIKDKLNAYSPAQDFTDGILTKLMPDLELINTVVFFTILFLGLDLISGEITGVVKGPFKFVLNTVLYLLGFFILFNILDNAVSIAL